MIEFSWFSSRKKKANIPVFSRLPCIYQCGDGVYNVKYINTTQVTQRFVQKSKHPYEQPFYGVRYLSAKEKRKKIFRKHSQVCVLATWMIGKVSVIGNVNRLIIYTKKIISRKLSTSTHSEVLQLSVDNDEPSNLTSIRFRMCSHIEALKPNRKYLVTYCTVAFCLLYWVRNSWNFCFRDLAPWQSGQKRTVNSRAASHAGCYCPFHLQRQSLMPVHKQRTVSGAQSQRTKNGSCWMSFFIQTWLCIAHCVSCSFVFHHSVRTDDSKQKLHTFSSHDEIPFKSIGTETMAAKWTWWVLLFCCLRAFFDGHTKVSAGAFFSSIHMKW